MTTAEKLAMIAQRVRNEEKPDVTTEVNWMYDNLMYIADSVAQYGMTKVETLLIYPETADKSLSKKSAINQALCDKLAENGFKYPYISQNNDTKIVFHFEE
jgi:hypothetical protein